MLSERGAFEGQREEQRLPGFDQLASFAFMAVLPQEIRAKQAG